MSLDRAMFDTGGRFNLLPIDLVRMFGGAASALVMARIEFRCRTWGYPDQILDEGRRRDLVAGESGVLGCRDRPEQASGGDSAQVPSGARPRGEHRT